MWREGIQKLLAEIFDLKPLEFHDFGRFVQDPTDRCVARSFVLSFLVEVGYPATTHQWCVADLPPGRGQRLMLRLALCDQEVVDPVQQDEVIVGIVRRML